MNKSSPTANSNSTTQTKRLPMYEEWTSHPLIDWLSENKNLLLWVFLGLIALLIIASQIINWRSLSNEKDYFQAESTFTQYQQISDNPTTSSAAEDDLALLQTLMERHPDLKPKYQGPIAQTLLITGQVVQAEPLINDIFKRTNPDHLNHYRDFTNASLFVAKGEYEKAIDASLQLKTALDRLKGDAHPVLYVFNLVRLGLLYQQTGQTEAERNIWKQLQNEPDIQKELQTVNGILNVGQANLSQYIEERKQALKQ